MVADLLERLARGDRLALSRLLSLASRGERLTEIRGRLARVVPGKDPPVYAITGSAGVGKSTLVGRLLERIRRDGLTVGVLACDPQSPLSGGALLGDAFRMNASHDPGLFIRSLATPGGHGGLAEHLDLMIRLLAAFGFDVLLIETVGAGQGDTTVRALADAVVLLVQPHAGDELQWEKAGLLEIADIVVVHKADLAGADQTAAQLQSMLALTSERVPPIVLASSATGRGIDDLWTTLHALPRRRAGRVVAEFKEASMKLLGKKALVTGAARGIGRGCALALARAGADVVINDRDRTPQGEETISEIEALGRRAALVEGDVFERASCESVAARALETLGRIDIFVSNPAFSRRAPFLEIDPALFGKVIQGTLVGGFHMSQLVARHMVERGGGGKIVFISSVHARIPFARSAAYNAAKSGLNHLAFTIAAELIRHRINVNVIEPGWIDTPGEHETFGDAFIAENAASLPWGRLGTPDDIGRAAAFLCSEDADYITGAALVVDGGFCLRAAMS